jgi:hypothetical protein
MRLISQSIRLYVAPEQLDRTIAFYQERQQSSVMYSGRSARGTLDGMFSTSCEGTLKMNSSG